MNSNIVNSKWDQRFMSMAKLVSTWSKDPSTKCGAVIADGKVIVSVGYNGFPIGIPDLPKNLTDRDEKYPRVIHAEINAITFAKGNLFGKSIYVYPMPPCVRCTTQIIQNGISRIITIKPTPEQEERWGGKDSEIAREMLTQALIPLHQICFK